MFHADDGLVKCNSPIGSAAAVCAASLFGLAGRRSAASTRRGEIHCRAMDALLQDTRFAFRSLRKSPAFSCAAIATIALGIGATTAIFSAMNAALLQPLPFPQSENLYTLRTTITTGRMTSGLVAPVEMNGLTDAGGPIVRAAGSVMSYDTMLDNTGAGVPVALAGVTEGFFELFNAPMVIGRSFTPDEFLRREGTATPRLIVLSNHLWKSAFGSDPHIVGRTVQFSGRHLPVIGIASPAYEAITTADAWYNAAVDRRNLSHSYDGYMRVRPGASPAAIGHELTSVAVNLANEFPVFNTNRIFVTTPLVDAIVGDLKPTLIITFAATTVLLLIACVNVMNLLFARAAARTREIAVRAALGANRAALVRYALLEGLLLSAVGGVIGLLVARGGVQLLITFGESRLPRLEAVPLDWSVTSFAIAITFATGIAIGLLPAIRLQRADVAALLGATSRSTTGGHGANRMLAGMVTAEMALAVTLVAGAGWLIQNYRNLQNADSGFVAENRIVLDVLLPAGRYQHPDQIDAWNHTLRDRIRQLAGVDAMGGSSSMPLRPERDSTFNFGIAGDPAAEYPPSARLRQVTPGWFEAMGIEVEAGRSFADNDRFGVGGVVVINQALADRYLSGRNPLAAGVVLNGFGTREAPNPVVPIVGVVANVTYASISERPEPALYMIGRGVNRQSIVVATSVANTSKLLPLIREEVKNLDPLVPVDVELLPNVVSASLSRQRLGMLLMSLFGAAGVALATIGVYGVIAYSVAQRVREVAIRLAIGATPAEVFRLTVVRALLIATAGVVGGLLLAYAAGRVLSTTLYEVRAADPLILVSAAILVAAVATLAALLPARSASQVSPVEVLRGE